VASGVYTVFGVTFPIIEETKFHRLMFDSMQAQGMGKWGFTMDPHEMAQLMIKHIDERRSALGIDKARERTLVDMADRRELKSA
jgi:carbon-monoxide dehydrogenase catalytic subunit